MGVEGSSHFMLDLHEPVMLSLQLSDMLFKHRILEIARAGTQFGNLLVQPDAKRPHAFDGDAEAVPQRILRRFQKDPKHTAPLHGYTPCGRRARWIRQYIVARSADPNKVTSRIASVFSSPLK